MKEKVKLSKSEKDRLTNPLVYNSLMHVISPFERAVLDNKFQPFYYKIANNSVYISNLALHEFKDIFFKKLDLFIDLTITESLSKDVPKELRDTFVDPDELNSLNVGLRNALQAMGCTTLFKIMEKRRVYFETELNIGHAALREIEQLFDKHNLAQLFHSTYHPYN